MYSVLNYKTICSEIESKINLIIRIDEEIVNALLFMSAIQRHYDSLTEVH